MKKQISATVEAYVICEFIRFITVSPNMDTPTKKTHATESSRIYKILQNYNP